MTRARNLANLGNKNALTADVGLFNIGIGSTQPTSYKLEVVGGNAYVGGGVTITGNLSVGGTITYEDVTNVDAVGIITAAKGFRATAGGVVVTAGVSTFPVVAVSAGTTTKDLKVTGVSTFSGVGQFGGNVEIASGTLHIGDEIAHYGDTDTNIGFPAADTFVVDTAGTERLRIDSSGRLLLGTTTEGEGGADDLTIATTGQTGITIRSGTSSGGQIYFADGTSGDDEYRGVISYQHGGDYMRFYTNALERMRIDSAGQVGVGTATPRGQFVVQSTKNALVNANCADPHHFHLSLKNTDEQSSAIGLCFSHDSTVDRVGAAIIHNRSGDGSVGDMRFYTSPTAGTTSQRLLLTSSGDIVTQDLTDTSFDNDGNNTKVLEITGDGTAGEYAVLNISGNQNADNTSVGALKFINRENSNSSTGANANSRQVGLIAAYSVTSDTNAGDDSGGYMQFATKPEAGGISEAMRIDSSGRVIIGGTSTEGHSAADELTISNTTSGADMGITLRSATNGQGAIYFSDGTSGDAEYRGIINYNHTSDFLNFYTAAGERLRIDSSGRLLLGTTTEGHAAAD